MLISRSGMMCLFLVFFLRGFAARDVSSDLRMVLSIESCKASGLDLPLACQFLKIY